MHSRVLGLLLAIVLLVVISSCAPSTDPTPNFIIINPSVSVTDYGSGMISARPCHCSLSSILSLH